MVLQMPRPTKSHKTGIYYFRARYPADLREKVGRDEFKVSLRTKDPEEAKRLFLEKEREFNSKCQALRACAANNLAVAIPYHRVVRNDGSLSGYALGR